MVAVGSGNLTVAGWWGNDELWTVHRGSEGVGSPVMRGVADWCRAVGHHVSIPVLGLQALERTASLLAGFESIDAPVRVVHSLVDPIINQLPVGPVDEMNLYAPFLDRDGIAVAALIERMQPRTVRLGFQPHLTSADGTALDASLDELVELIELPTDRYRHGKLVEWRIDDEWFALTGSANLSTSALCQSTNQDGN